MCSLWGNTEFDMVFPLRYLATGKYTGLDFSKCVWTAQMEHWKSFVRGVVAGISLKEIQQY